MSSASIDFDRAILEFMADFPLTVTYVKYGVGVFNPATGETTNTTTQYSVSAIIQDLMRTSNGVSTKFDTLIQQGDKEIYIKPIDGLVISSPTQDSIIVNNITYSIVVMRELNPTMSAPILYNFMVRQ